MSIKKVIENFTYRKIGVQSGGTHYITIPPDWGKKGETVIVERTDDNTLTVSRNKKIMMEPYDE